MTEPTAQQIRDMSLVDFTSLGFDDDNVKLAIMVERATAFIEFATGRTFDTLPTEFEPLATEATQRLTELYVHEAQPERRERMGDYEVVANFSAGSYSETRRGLDEYRKSGMIHSDPAIHRLLWAMATDDRRDDWLWWGTGQIPPAFETTEVDWSGELAEGNRLGWYGPWQMSQ